MRRLRPSAHPRTTWCLIGTDPSQTRARRRAIVDREGGGTALPTLGGGLVGLAGAAMPGGVTGGSGR